MEVIRRSSQHSRPSSAMLGAQVDLSGEASPVPSWVVPSRTGGGMTTTTTTHHGYNTTGIASATIPSYNIGASYTTGGGIVGGASYTTIGEATQPMITTTTTTEKTTTMDGGYNLGTVATEAHYIAGQRQGMMEGGASMMTTTTPMIEGSASIGGALSYQQQSQQQYITGSTVGEMAAVGSVGGYTTVTTTGEGIRKDSRVVGREYGAQRLVSETRRVDESRQSVISERYVEHEIRIPKKIIREEVIEKVIVIPETVRHEEVIDDVKVVREKIVEVAKPTIVEKVVEIPEIEYIERVVEVPERVVQEKIVHKPVVQHVDRVVEVQKVITKEVPRVIPEITYRDVPVEKVVERVEWIEKVVDRPVVVPQYVDKPVPQEVIVENVVDVDVKIPVPIEAEVVHEYHLPQIKPRYTKATYPVYLPRFIEVPVATELLREDLKLKSTAFVGQIGALTQSAASLCEIENLAAQIMKSGDINSQTAVDVQSAVMRAWQSNSLHIKTGDEIALATSANMTAAAAVPTIMMNTLPPRTVETQQTTYVVSARSPLHADIVSKGGASKKSKRSSKSHDKKN